ncbi:hypothetical protein EMIHUDRAFT_241860 [Emiliania huxleyi CCMP1516]|nr:hypothetical protein EMIHUDRAFT_241860 [Emiliania huxleyi CCMP1516]EOD20780.1 hypothetical protein EMIHUDRAFT_241860 [Emiliania huxleyi CCMP1516]|eukprot:XP_005773209.1 hypothetical protein EMIHUDRAFT_241860 [Emiliania huxleyi CCMP1516]
MAARPATGIAAQLEELQRKYRIMECDRKSYAEEVEAVLRKQKLQNEKLRRESQSLKAELSLEARAASASETAVASVKETQVRDLIKEVGRQIDAEKQRGEKLDARLKSLRDRSLQERKEMGGHNAPAEHTMSTDKCIKALERRLHQSLIKFNEAITANKELRAQIDDLRRERVVFDGVHRRMQNELAERKRRMADIIEAANAAFEARDKAHGSAASLRLIAEREQLDFEAQWKKMGLQARYRSAPQAAVAEEARRGLASVGRIEPYEEAFSQIRSATGSSDIDALVEAFIAKEDANFKAYNYLNALAAEVERSEEAVAALHGEAESFRGADRGASSQRRRLVTELSDQAAEGEAKAEQLSESSRKLSGAISSICKIAHRLVGRTCSDRDLNKIGGCDENSLMLFMGMIEHAANETLGPAALDASAGAPRGGPSAKAVTSTMVLGAERLHSDSDEEAGVPLSRNELQLRTMRGIERREAKPAASRRGSEAGQQRRQPKGHRG